MERPVGLPGLPGMLTSAPRTFKCLPLQAGNLTQKTPEGLPA